MRYRTVLATGMLAITTYFHYVRLLGILAVLTTILAIFFRRAIASGMRAFVFLVLCHNTTLLSSYIEL